MSNQQIREYLINNIVDKLIEFYMADNSVSLQEALEVIYSSKTYDMLLVHDSYLPSQSPDYVYELLKVNK